MKYKTLEKLKEELGDNFDKILYKSNIELLTKINSAIEFIKENYSNADGTIWHEEMEKILKILANKYTYNAIIRSNNEYTK